MNIATPMLSDLNALVTLALGGFVLVSGFCRISIIEMRSAQYLRVAPTFIATVFAAFVLWSLIGGDRPDYFTPVGLLACAVAMYNSKADWAHGMPYHMLRRQAFAESSFSFDIAKRRMTLQNAVVAFSTAITLGVTGSSAMDRGDPLLIFSAYAQPRITTPNGEISIVYSLRRVRVCSGYVERFIIRADNESTAQSFLPTPIGGATIGKTVNDLKVKIKLDNLPIGAYIYRANITHQCDDSPAPYIKRTPDVPFVVGPEPVKTE